MRVILPSDGVTRNWIVQRGLWYENTRLASERGKKSQKVKEGNRHQEPKTGRTEHSFPRENDLPFHSDPRKGKGLESGDGEEGRGAEEEAGEGQEGREIKNRGLRLKEEWDTDEIRKGDRGEERWEVIRDGRMRMKATEEGEDETAGKREKRGQDN